MYIHMLICMLQDIQHITQKITRMENFMWWTCLLICMYLVLVSVKKAGIYIWWRPIKIEKFFSKQGIRGPPYNLLIGNLREIVHLSIKASSQPLPDLSHNILPRVLSFYHHWQKIYGANFLIWFGPTVRLTISDPALIKEIFVSKSECFEKYDAHPSVRKLEGDGLTNLDGEKWAHHRKLINPVFYEENLKVMIPTIEKGTANMLSRWLRTTSSGKIEIDISKWFPCLSEEVVMRTVFGSSYEDGNSIYKLQEVQMIYAIESFQSVPIPGYRYLPTKKNRNSWKMDKEINKSLNNLIAKRIGDYTNHRTSLDIHPSDLLHVMITASLTNKTITISDIIEECKAFFFAGKHTTSMMMTWAVILLAMHPQWQDRAREEVTSVYGQNGHTPSKDDVARLKLLGMILNETLRLYPPIVATIRRPKIDLTLGGYEIPRGTELLIPILAVHHDHTLWGSDVNEFNPARYANGVAQAAKHPMAHIPFGLGARHCIGQNLAVLQTKLVIAAILKQFKFEISPHYKHAPSVDMLLRPQYGAPIVFHKL